MKRVREREASKKPVWVLNVLRMTSPTLWSKIKEIHEDSMDWRDGSMGSQIDVQKHKDLSLDLHLPHESLAWQHAPVIPSEDGK